MILLTSSLALNVRSEGLHIVIEGNEVKNAEVICEGDACLQNTFSGSKKDHLTKLRVLDKLMEGSASSLASFAYYEDKKNLKIKIDAILQYSDFIQKKYFLGERF